MQRTSQPISPAPRDEQRLAGRPSARADGVPPLDRLHYRDQSGQPALEALLLDVYRLAVLTRAVDERLWALSRLGQINFVLTPRGHEIAQIASALALRVGQDSAWLYYRDMAVALALGVSPYEIFLGAMARADDPHSGGRQLTMHLASPALRIGTMSSAVAANLPHAVGAAYAARVLGEDSVAVCYFGDGATGEGDTHESMNWAAVHKLPVVFICENNGYAISTPVRLQAPLRTLAERAAAYAMPGLTIDGGDAAAVYGATRDALQRARAGDGPSFLELCVPRMTPHSSQDDDAYRTEAQRQAAAAADPLPRLRGEVLGRGLLSEADEQALGRELREQVYADAQRAQARPAPEPGRARRWLYAGDPPHPYQAELERGRGRTRGD
jgi:2-oxoisovalerate dehydrogenase E1 component alpha subunit